MLLNPRTPVCVGIVVITMFLPIFYLGDAVFKGEFN